MKCLKLLADMLLSLERMEIYGIDRVSFKDFKENNMMMDATERRMMIIGGALYQGQ